MKRQAVVNAGVTFRFRNETAPSKFETTDFQYENGIVDYVAELAGEGALTLPEPPSKVFPGGEKDQR